MMTADKYKKNKFRKLVPTSNSESQKLQQLATIDHQKEIIKPHLTISQDIRKNGLRVGVQEVSQRYKQKHFVFERRLKTISSMIEREEGVIKHSNSSISQCRLQRQRPENKKPNQLQQLMKIIEQFKTKAEHISKAQCLEQLGTNSHQGQGEESTERKMEGLTERTKATALRLICIYINRLIMSWRKEILLQIVQFFPEKTSTYEALMHQIESKPLKQGDEGVPRPQRTTGRRNLINVSKFFGSI